MRVIRPEYLEFVAFNRVQDIEDEPIEDRNI